MIFYLLIKYNSFLNNNGNTYKIQEKKNQYLDNNNSRQQGCFPFFFHFQLLRRDSPFYRGKRSINKPEERVIALDVYIEQELPRHWRHDFITDIVHIFFFLFFLLSSSRCAVFSFGDDTVDVAIPMPWHYNLRHTSKYFALYIR